MDVIIYIWISGMQMDGSGEMQPHLGFVWHWDLSKVACYKQTKNSDMLLGGLQNKKKEERLTSTLVPRGFIIVSQVWECSYRGSTGIQDNSDSQNDQKWWQKSSLAPNEHRLQGDDGSKLKTSGTSNKREKITMDKPSAIFLTLKHKILWSYRLYLIR